MDNKVKIIPTVIDDVLELAPKLRQEDIAEILALGSTSQKSLLKGFIYSDECCSAKLNNETIGIFGVSSYEMPKGFASIWMLGSDKCKQVPITFVKVGIEFINKWLKDFSILINAVDKRNTTHIEWIKRCGMTISSPININGYEFLQFYKIRKLNK